MSISPISNNLGHLNNNQKYNNNINNNSNLNSKKSVVIPHSKDLQHQRGSLISNRKASSNNGKNNNSHIDKTYTNNYLLNTYNANNPISNSQNVQGNNSPKYNSVNYIYNNDNSKSNNINNFFEFKICNFCEIFNSLIKENVMNNNNTNINCNNPNNLNNYKNQVHINNNTNNNNQNHNNSYYTQISNKNVNNANTYSKKRHTFNVNLPNYHQQYFINNNNININTNINQNFMHNHQNSNQINSNNINNIFTFDLQNFFYENNLNYQYFVDLLSNINNKCDKETFNKYKSSNKTKYIICLAKCNKTHNIKRWPITNYEISISPKKYFFVIEGEESFINNFYDDYKFVSEKLNKTEEDGFAIYNDYVNKKLKYELNKIKEIEKSLFKTNVNLVSNDIFNEIDTNNFVKSNKLIQANNNDNNENNNGQKTTNKKSLKNTLVTNNNTQNNNKYNNNKLGSKNLIDLNVHYEADPNQFNVIKVFFVTRILPEGKQKGLLLVYSNSLIRFKPITNNYKYARRELISNSDSTNNPYDSQQQYLEIKLSKVESIIKYRYLFRYKAINIFLFQSQRSKIFDFECEKDFEEFYGFMLKNCKNLDKTIDDIEHHTYLWQFGSLSNFEYLMYLNTIASRSFSDLSQYPIFPWIISNYEDIEELDLTDAKNFRDLSKPIGALSQYKLERFLSNYTDMQKRNPKDQAYIFSEHYSNPSHIIYFLVRSHPQFQMKFKSGSLGPPERLFNSIRDCWSHILNINNDTKEVTPEFYFGSGDFLVNVHGLDFGETANGTKVDDAHLPKWAKSPAHFVSVLKSALESKYVSSNMHLWIDLIFGCKQKAESAKAANNLFYHMTYESALEANCDENFQFENEFKKQAFYTQLSEFGQVPKQLFDKPHPAKKAFSIYSANYFISNAENASQEEIMFKIELLIKENKRLEEQCVKMEREKTEEKEMLIKSHEEIELKRKEKLKMLKE